MGYALDAAIDHTCNAARLLFHAGSERTPATRDVGVHGFYKPCQAADGVEGKPA
jgi:hypothetical protein